MKRLAVWFDRNCQPAGFVQRCHDRAPFETALEIREVGPAEIARARDALGAMMWREYATSAGQDGFFHFMAFDAGRPGAIGALAAFEGLGYLRGSRRRGRSAARRSRSKPSRVWGASLTRAFQRCSNISSLCIAVASAMMFA